MNTTKLPREEQVFNTGSLKEVLDAHEMWRSRVSGSPVEEGMSFCPISKQQRLKLVTCQSVDRDG